MNLIKAGFGIVMQDYPATYDWVVSFFMGDIPLNDKISTWLVPPILIPLMIGLLLAFIVAAQW